MQDRIDRTDAWNLDRTLDTAMDALRCPPSDADVATLSGGERRRVALCRVLLVVARPAAPRRADQPPRRRVRRLARAVPRRVRRDGARRHPRPLLPRQRRRLDPRARPRARHPVPGQLHVLARAEAGPAGRRGEAGVGAPPDARPELEWVRMAPRARHAKSKARVASYEQLLADEANVKLDRVEIHIPAGPAARRRRGRGQRGQQGLRRPAALRGLVVLAAAGRHRRRDRRERRRQDHALSHDRRRGVARRRRADRRVVGRARLRRPGAVRSRSRDDGVEGDLRRQGHRSLSGSERSHRGPTRPRSTSAAATSRSASATCRAASETASTSPSSFARAATCCCSTSRPTISTSTRCAPSRTPLVDFAGCAVVISHDRWFLDRVATHMLAFEGDSEVVWFEGTYDEYEQNRRSRLGAEADQPHRIKYKPLLRS